MKKIILVTLTVLIFLSAGLVRAQGPQKQRPDEAFQVGAQPKMKLMMRDGMHGKMMPTIGLKRHNPIMILMPKVREELKLTDDQVSKIEQIVMAKQKKCIDIKAEIDKMMIDSMFEMKELYVDISKAETRMRQIGELRIELEISGLQAFEQAVNTLTDDQKNKLEEIWKKRGRHKPGEMKHKSVFEDVIDEQVALEREISDIIDDRQE